MAGRWTLKEVVQGKPLGHPSHPMFVHFPVAFYIGALGFDVLSRIGFFPAAPQAATWLILGAALAWIPVITTGLVDYAGMRNGSKSKKTATRHLVCQLYAVALFILVLALRWSSRDTAIEAKTLWIALEAVAVVFMLAGNFLGGILVYRMGMRVGETPPAKKTEPAADQGAA